jgi:hypothetical protein
MVSYEFNGLVGKLCAFYERKKPNDTTMDLWFDVVEKIPSNELEAIFDRIIKDHDTFPKNLTGAMWANHYELAAQNRLSTIEKVYDPCPECNQGLLHLQKKNDAGIYSRYVFRCDTCKQRKENYPWGNKIILRRSGFEEIPIAEGAEQITNWAQLQNFIDNFANLPF